MSLSLVGAIVTMSVAFKPVEWRSISIGLGANISIRFEFRGALTEQCIPCNYKSRFCDVSCILPDANLTNVFCVLRFSLFKVFLLYEAFTLGNA